MAEVDELMELREAIPPPPARPLPQAWVVEQRLILVAKVSGAGTRDRIGPAPRHRRRARVVVLALLPAALIGGAMAYSMSAHRTAAQLGNFVMCFTTPKLDAPSAGSSFTGPGDLATFCDHAWESGSSRRRPPARFPRAGWRA